MILEIFNEIFFCIIRSSQGPPISFVVNHESDVKAI